MTNSTKRGPAHGMGFIAYSATPKLAPTYEPATIVLEEMHAAIPTTNQVSTLASRMAYARELKGRIWSQKHLAEQAGVSLATIGMLESGKRGNTPRVPGTIPAIAKAMGISYEWLAYGKGDMLTPEPARSADTAIDSAVAADANNMAMLVQAIEPSRRPAAVRAATQTLIGFLRPLPQPASD